MTYRIEIFLPLVEDSEATFRNLRRDLCERFGGLTAHNRAPAEGVWRDGNSTEKDKIVIIEVMTETLDRGFWRELRQRLESALGQKEIVIRAHTVERL